MHADQPSLTPTDRNIVCLASNWFYDPTSKHHLMKRLAERNHVVWVNYHASRRPAASAADLRAVAGKLRQFIAGPQRVSPGMTVITPAVVPLPGSRTAMALNRRLLGRQIQDVLNDLPPRPTQLWTFAPDADYLCGAFNEECVVYYCVDDFASFTGYDARAIRAAEERLCEKADLVIATSQRLYDARRPQARYVRLVPHGVDYDHFARARSTTAAPPPDLASLPRPVLGFWGLIHDWVDVQLIADIAAIRPGWSIVLIGDVATDVSALSERRNVHLLGRRPYVELPDFAAAFDVALIPFRLNDLTRAVNPIKLREYLSAGLPVVSTPLPEMNAYPQFVWPAADGDEFVSACERAMRDNSAEAAQHRQQAMQSETWSARLADISTYVRQAVHMAASRRQPAIAGG